MSEVNKQRGKSILFPQSIHEAMFVLEPSSFPTPDLSGSDTKSQISNNHHWWCDRHRMYRGEALEEGKGGVADAAQTNASPCCAGQGCWTSCIVIDLQTLRTLL
jgi:hypothetical protein